MLHAATEAFAEGLVDFFPDPASRAKMRLAMGKAKQVHASLLSRQEKAIGAMDPEAEADKLIATLKGLSGNSPASSVSTPALSPSAS